MSERPRTEATQRRGWRGIRRWAAIAWPVVQSAAAATIAWIIASRFAGHDDPFFAPIAAVVALNTSVGERGRQAVRLVLGVTIGIVAGEIALGSIGSGTVGLGVATLAAMLAAETLGGARIVLAQAAAGAILTVATGEHIGPDRLIDALIGAAVALSFTQLLFAPEPMKMLRRAETAVLKEMAAALRLTGRALRQGDTALGEEAMARHRALRDRLGELASTRAASVRTARHSLVWRSSTEPLVQEHENAGHLDLLGGSVLMVTRTALTADMPDRERLAHTIEALAAILGDLARSLGDRPGRQAAVDRSLAMLRAIDAARARPGSAHAAVIASLQAAATDVLVVAGVGASEAEAAVRAGAGALTVTKPPRARSPFRWMTALLRRVLRPRVDR